MKNKQKFLSHILVICLLIGCADRNSENAIFNAQLGIYVLDMHKTQLGDYLKDSSLYKRLHISFRKDSTFTMNMKVPFIYDSIGDWEAGDGSAYSYNQLFYKSFIYPKNATGDHFYPPYIENSDTIFLLYTPTPQDGAESIKQIYFKKESQ